MTKAASVQLSAEDKRAIADEGAHRKGDDSFTEATPEELAAQADRKSNEKAARDDAIVEGRTADLDALPSTGLPSGRCPGCGELTHDNMVTAEELTAMDSDADPSRQFICTNDECSAEWGPKLPSTAVATGPKYQDLPKTGLPDYHCPHCDTYVGKNGSGVTEYAELSPNSQRDTLQQFTCNSCAGEWGPVVSKPKSARRSSGSSNGLRIEKDREERNGVTRPSAGGKCRGVWDMLDAIGTDATAKQAREAADGKFDKTTTMVQFYKWRKFNGIQGRS